MNVFAKFDEIPSMILKVIKETKRYGHTVGRSVGQRENSIPSRKLYPPTNTVCGGYNYHQISSNRHLISSSEFLPSQGFGVLAMFRL